VVSQVEPRLKHAGMTVFEGNQLNATSCGELTRSD